MRADCALVRRGTVAGEVGTRPAIPAIVVDVVGAAVVAAAAVILAGGGVVGASVVEGSVVGGGVREGGVVGEGLIERGVVGPLERISVAARTNAPRPAPRAEGSEGAGASTQAPAAAPISSATAATPARLAAANPRPLSSTGLGPGTPPLLLHGNSLAAGALCDTARRSASLPGALVEDRVPGEAVGCGPAPSAGAALVRGEAPRRSGDRG